MVLCYSHLLCHPFFRDALYPNGSQARTALSVVVMRTSSMSGVAVPLLVPVFTQEQMMILIKTQDRTSKSRPFIGPATGAVGFDLMVPEWA